MKQKWMRTLAIMLSIVLLAAEPFAVSAEEMRVTQTAETANLSAEAEVEELATDALVRDEAEGKTESVSAEIGVENVIVDTSAMSEVKNVEMDASEAIESNPNTGASSDVETESERVLPESAEQGKEVAGAPLIEAVPLESHTVETMLIPANTHSLGFTSIQDGEIIAPLETLRVQWSSCAEASYYLFSARNFSSDGSEDINASFINREQTTNTYYSIPGKYLTENTQFRFWVAAFSADGTELTSATIEISTGHIEEALKITNLSDGQTIEADKDVLIQWNSISGADHYEFSARNLDLDGDTAFIERVSTEVSYYQIFKNDIHGGCAYRFWVGAVDAHGDLMDTAQVEVETSAGVPIVEVEVVDIAPHKVTVRGQIVSDGGSEITEYGVLEDGGERALGKSISVGDRFTCTHNNDACGKNVFGPVIYVRNKIGTSKGFASVDYPCCHQHGSSWSYDELLSADYSDYGSQEFHEVNNAVWEVNEHCKNCWDKIFDTKTVQVEDSVERHEYEGDVCILCKHNCAENSCKHANTVLVASEEYFSTRDYINTEDATGHEVRFNYFAMDELCVDCGECVGTEIPQEGYCTAHFAHTFIDDEGIDSKAGRICQDCGYKLTCPHDNIKYIGYRDEIYYRHNALYIPVDEKVHRWQNTCCGADVEYDDYWQCQDCLVYLYRDFESGEFHHYYGGNDDITSWEPEKHSFENGECVYCGQKQPITAEAPYVRGFTMSKSSAMVGEEVTFTLDIANAGEALEVEFCADDWQETFNLTAPSNAYARAFSQAGNRKIKFRVRTKDGTWSDYCPAQTLCVLKKTEPEPEDEQTDEVIKVGNEYQAMEIPGFSSGLFVEFFQGKIDDDYSATYKRWETFVDEVDFSWKGDRTGKGGRKEQGNGYDRLLTSRFDGGGNLEPVRYVKIDNFSAHFSGFIIRPEQAVYNIRVVGDDKVRLNVNVTGRDKPSGMGWFGKPAQNEVTVDFSEVSGCSILIDYYNKSGAAKVKLEWKRKDEKAYRTVPGEYLYHSDYGFRTCSIIDNREAEIAAQITEFDEERREIASKVIQNLAMGKYSEAIETPFFDKDYIDKTFGYSVIRNVRKNVYKKFAEAACELLTGEFMEALCESLTDDDDSDTADTAEVKKKIIDSYREYVLGIGNSLDKNLDAKIKALEENWVPEVVDGSVDLIEFFKLVAETMPAIYQEIVKDVGEFATEDELYECLNNVLTNTETLADGMKEVQSQYKSIKNVMDIIEKSLKSLKAYDENYYRSYFHLLYKEDPEMANRYSFLLTIASSTIRPDNPVYNPDNVLPENQETAFVDFLDRADNPNLMDWAKHFNSGMNTEILLYKELLLNVMSYASDDILSFA